MAGYHALTAPDQIPTDYLSSNQELVARLYIQHAEELRHFLLGVQRDADLTSEVLQATFVKALETVHTSQEETRKAWLFRVAYNQALENRRRHKRQSHLMQKAAWNKPPAENDTPTDELTRWETVAQVREALNALPEDQRIVVQKRIYEEKTFAVIARELGVPLGTVLTRMRAALKKLAQHQFFRPES